MIKPTIMAATFLAAISNNAVANDCGNNDFATKLSQLIINDVQQQRVNLICDQRLVLAAIKKVNELVETEHFYHGRANGRLRDEGFKLPEYYGIGMANQVEAIAGGQSSAQQVWKEFKLSEGHADHLLGRSDFYLEQNKIGIAHVYKQDSEHRHYWVVYVAKESIAKEQDIFYGPIPNKSTTGIIYHEQINSSE